MLWKVIVSSIVIVILFVQHAHPDNTVTAQDEVPSSSPANDEAAFTLASALTEADARTETNAPFEAETPTEANALTKTNGNLDAAKKTDQNSVTNTNEVTTISVNETETEISNDETKTDITNIELLSNDTIETESTVNEGVTNMETMANDTTPTVINLGNETEVELVSNETTSTEVTLDDGTGWDIDKGATTQLHIVDGTLNAETSDTHIDVFEPDYEEKMTPEELKMARVRSTTEEGERNISSHTDEAKFEETEGESGKTNTTLPNTLEEGTTEPPTAMEEMEEVEKEEEEEDKPDQTDILFVDDNIIGEYAAMIAYTLRENLINLLGYLMFQITVDTETEIYFYIHELKMGVEGNNIDVFRLIPVLPDLYNKPLNDQLKEFLHRVELVCEMKFCQVKCTARLWRQHKMGIDMEMAVGHFGYNPILTGIIDKPRDVIRLRALVKKLKMPFEPSAKLSELTKIFSIFIVRIMHEIEERQTSLTDQLTGYILPFYPWPLNDYDVDLALSTMTRFLLDERTSLIKCGVEIRNDVVSVSFHSMTKLMTDIMHSRCDRPERMAAQVLLNALQTQLTIPNYRNIFKGVYAEINRLWDLLNIVNHENYPLEIVLARERVKRYIDKAIFYLNYPRFVAYKYKTPEETLIAFLDFVLQETPHPPLVIKMSIAALKAYLLFFTGPREISYNLLLTIMDGCLAPDLNDNIIDHFVAIKTFILDEAVTIGHILQSAPTRKCTDLLVCYLQIIAMLKENPQFVDKVHYLEVPQCVLLRFMNIQVLPDDLHFKQPDGRVDIVDLLDTLDYHQFTREVVLSGKQIKDYMLQNHDKATVKSRNVFCTKQETLLDYLQHIQADSAKYPANIIASIKAVIPALTFKLSSIVNVNVGVIKLITKAWHSPFTDQRAMFEISRMEAILQSNEKELDMILNDMDPHKCVGLLECYNAVVEHLGNIDSSFGFKTRYTLSPELYVLNLGSLTKMTTKLIVNIVNTVQTYEMDDSELEAAKSYIMDFEMDIDLVIKDVDCSNKQVIPCFSILLDKMRFNDYINHVEINIVQYLLTPTTCDNKNCWWYPHEELGSTILNPLLQYIMYLLEHYSVYEIRSLHLHMDIFQIVQYLDTEDVEDVLAKFKIKVYNNNLEKLKAFLGFLAHSSLLEEHVMQSVRNIYEYISKNSNPDRLNIGNLSYLKQLFKTLTLNTTVHVELDEVEDKIRAKRNEIKILLKDLYVECYALRECIKEIDDQLNTVAFDTPPAKIIKKLLKPESCLESEQICPWIIPGVSVTLFIKETVIPEIQKYINDEEITLIEKIFWKILMYILKANFDIFSDNVSPPDRTLTTRRKLEVIVEKLLEQKYLPRDMKKVLVQIKTVKPKKLKDKTNGFVVDADVLQEILLKMVENTRDEVTVNDIKDMLIVLENNKKVFDGILSSIKTPCQDLKECVKDIFDGVVKQKLADKEIIKVLLDVFLAEKCPKGDCPWQVTADIKKCTLFRNKLKNLLTEFENREATPFHIKLDIYDVLDYLDRANVLRTINNVLVFNVFSKPDDVLHQILHALGQAKDIPARIRVSMTNILDYLLKRQIPMFIQASNLIRLIGMLKEVTTSNVVQRIMNDAVVFLKKYKQNAIDILEMSSVNCTSIDSCVNTLYVEMEKQKHNNVAQIILSVLNPSMCTPKSCPWIKQLVEKNMKEVEETLRRELEALQHRHDVPLIIKLDVQVFKKIVNKCSESLIKVVEMLTQEKPSEKLLPIFIKTLDNGVLVENDVVYIKVDLENYLTSNALPKYIDVNTLLMYGKLLKMVTKNEVVRSDIEVQRVKIIYEKENVRKVMLNCPVNCVSVKKCAETIEMCLQQPPMNDEPVSVIVSKLIRPESCDRSSCPWLPHETRKELIAKFEAIKDEIKRKIHNADVPVIIQSMLMIFLKQLEFDKKTERYLQHIAPNHPDKLLELQKHVKKDKANHLPNLLTQVVKIIDYLMSKRIPGYLTSAELPGFVMLLVEISQQPDIKEYLEAALNLIMKKPAEADATLKGCPVKCVELKSCMSTLAQCLKKGEYMMSLWILHLIYPDPCTPMVCSWIPENFVGIETTELPIKTPRTMYPDKMILFFQDSKKWKSITLDLTLDRTLVMLQAFTFIDESFLRRTTVVTAKGSPKKYLIDYLYLKGIRRVGKEIKPVIDFSKDDSKIVCVQYKNGQIRPLKFDLKKDGVQEALKRLSWDQRDLVKNQKPFVTIVDLDGSKNSLTIDVLDSNVIRKILEQTIDDVMPQSYAPVFFWPKDMGAPWRAAIIEKKSLLEAYLRNLAGLDLAYKEAPVIVTFDGIITMDFDINDMEIVHGIETTTGNQSTVLDLSKQKRYMFYIPFPFQKNMIPFPIDFNNPNVLNILIKANEKFKVAESLTSTLLVKKEDGETVQLQFDFYGDIFVYLVHNINKKSSEKPAVEARRAEITTLEKPPLSNTGGILNLVIIFVNKNSDYVFLDLENPLVRERLLKEFVNVPRNKNVVAINVPDNQGNLSPVVIDPNNEDVIDILKSLSQKTSTAFLPINVVTADGKKAIVCAVTSEYKVLSMIMEDNAANLKKLNKEKEDTPLGDIYEFNFENAEGANDKLVKLSEKQIAKLLSDNPPEITSVGLTYVGVDIDFDEFVVPLKVRDTLYHITFNSFESDLLELLKKYPYSDQHSGTTFVARNDKNAMEPWFLVTLPNTKAMVEQLRPWANNVEVNINTDSIMVIVTSYDGDVRPFILDLSDEVTMSVIQHMSKKVDPTSTTKALFHCKNNEGEMIEIILDYMNYDHNILWGLEQETPLELKTIQIPNLDSSVPLIGFMILGSMGSKMSVVLNPADSVVWEALVSIDKEATTHSTPIRVIDKEGKQHVFKIDKTDKKVVQKLSDLIQRTRPSHMPVKPIPADGSSIINVYVMENRFKVKKDVNTRDDFALKYLLEAAENLPVTKPVILVINSDGKAVPLRIDTTGYGPRDRGFESTTTTSNENNFLVVKPRRGHAIVLDMMDPAVSMKLHELEEEGNNKNARMIIYADSLGRTQTISLDTRNTTLMEEMWKLQQIAMPPNLPPFIVAPENGKFHYVFTVPDESGNKRVIILDVTNSQVKAKLIKMSDVGANGIPLKMEGGKGEPVTIYVDTSNKAVLKNLIFLSELTRPIETPIVSGISTDKIRIIKIPIQDGDKNYLINCNVSDPLLIRQLIGIYGQKSNGVVFTFKNRRGLPAIIYLDLNSKKVIDKLSKICASKTTVLDPKQVLVFDMKTAFGEHTTNVIDLSNQDVAQEFMQRCGGSKGKKKKKKKIIKISYIDSSGIPKFHEINIRDPDIQDLLQHLTGITIGNSNINSIYIPGSGGTSKVVIIFGILGPLYIDQTNEALVTQILKLSTPNDPNAVKVTFIVGKRKELVGYFDLSNHVLMEQIQQIINQFFQGHKVIPPAMVPDNHIIKIPCVNREGQGILILLDTTDYDVIEILEHESVEPGDEDFNIKIITMKNGQVDGVYYIDTSNEATCEQLKLVAFSYCYQPIDGSLLVINLPNKVTPVVILDMSLEFVKDELELISDKVPIQEATHWFLYLGVDAKSVILKINIKKEWIVCKLIKLAARTPEPIAPIAIANPYGVRPLVIFTVRLKNHDVKHIVLNLENTLVLNKIKLLSKYYKPKKPLEITYIEPNEKRVHFMLDAANDRVLRKLFNLMKHTRPINDAILNMPQRNPIVNLKLFVSIENESGFSGTFTIDMTNQHHMEDFKIKAEKLKKTTPVLILYFRDYRDFVEAIRVDPKEIFPKAEKLKPIIQLISKYVLILTIVKKNDVVVPIILYLKIKKVLLVLIEISENTPLDKPHTTVTIEIENGKLIMINLDLNDEVTQMKILELMLLTPHPTEPIIVTSPFGVKPLLVLTIEGPDGKTLPIFLDLNDDNVIEILDELSNPSDERSWTVTIPGAMGVDITIVINPHLQSVKENLMEMSSSIIAILAPITPNPVSILILELTLEDNCVMEVPINIKDPYVIGELIQMIKDWPSDSDDLEGIQIFIECETGINLPIEIDTAKPQVVNIIMQLGQRVIAPSVFVITPETGRQPLIIGTIPLRDGILVVVIDVNNPKVIDTLREISEPVTSMKEVTIISVKPDYGEPFNVIINRNKNNIRLELIKITAMTPVFVCPIRVIPPGGKNPILSMIVRLGYNATLLVIDFNDKNVVEVLKSIDSTNSDDVTKIEFVHPNGTQDSVNINLNDPTIIYKIKNLVRPTVYPLPIRHEHPALVVQQDRTKRILDLTNPDIVDILVSLSGKPKDKDKFWTVEIKNKDGLSIIVYIDFNSPEFKHKVQKIIVNVQIPPVNVIIPNIIKVVEVCPIKILPPGGKYPLIMIVFWDIGPVTIDINQEDVFHNLTSISEETDSDTIIIEVADQDGNIVIIKIQPEDEETQSVITELTEHTVISFEPNGKPLPILIVTVNEWIYEFDLSNATIIAILQELNNPNSPDSFKIQIPLAIHILTIELVPEDIDPDLNIPKKPEKVKPTRPPIDIIVDATMTTQPYPDESSMTTPYYPDADDNDFTTEVALPILTIPVITVGTEITIDYETTTDDEELNVEDLTTTDDTSELTTDYETATDDEEPNIENPPTTENPSEITNDYETTTDDEEPNIEDVTTTESTPQITIYYETTTEDEEPNIDVPSTGQTSASIPDHADGSIATLIPFITTSNPEGSGPTTMPLETTEQTTRYTTTGRYPTVTSHPIVITTNIVVTSPDEDNYIYWVTFNLTNLVTFETYAYVFDVSNPDVVNKLKEYVISLLPNEKITSVTLPFPNGPFVLYINPYDLKTFMIFKLLTYISTGKYPVLVSVIKPKTWWNFTITDQYQNNIKLELDVANELVLQKIKQLNEMYQPGGSGVIIKGTLADGKQFQLIIDPKCMTTLENLFIIMNISHGGPNKPLKPLPNRDKNQNPHLIKFEINLPGAGQVLTIILDVSKKEVLDALLDLDRKYVEGNANYVITINIEKKTYKIRLNLWDKDTLEKLLELSEKSTGKEVIAKETFMKILELLYLPSLVTIEINDGEESIPVTIDVTDKQVIKILNLIQTKEQTYATIIMFTDRNNVTHKFSLNINDKQVIGILSAIGLPTISPRKAAKFKLLTFIFIKDNLKGGHTAVLLDLADKGTIIFFMDLVSRYTKQFKKLTYLEVRDDNGQYVSVAVDLYHTGFKKQLIKGSLASKRHKIEWSDVPFLVLVVPNRSRKNTYEAYKFRLHDASFVQLKKLKPGKKPVVIQVVDSADATTFYVNPDNDGFIKDLAMIPGIAIIQHSLPKPMVVIYIVEHKMVTPIYLNMKDPKTFNKLIEMHNNYARSNGREPLTLLRFVTAAGETQYLFAHLDNQIALKELSKLTVQVGAHHFIKQRIEKVTTLSIPQRQGKNLVIHLNLADPYVVSELRRMSREQLNSKHVQTFDFVDAYNNALVVKLDLYDTNVVSQLLKLSMK